jgi:hypothetical protein
MVSLARDIFDSSSAFIVAHPIAKPFSAFFYGRSQSASAALPFILLHTTLPDALVRRQPEQAEDPALLRQYAALYCGGVDMTPPAEASSDRGAQAPSTYR